jgi:hypothetical protein
VDRPAKGPDPADVALFPAPDPGRDETTVAIGPVTHRRPKRPGRSIAIGGAVLAVVGSAVLAGALTSGNGDMDETSPDAEQPTAVVPSDEPPDAGGLSEPERQSRSGERPARSRPVQL